MVRHSDKRRQATAAHGLTDSHRRAATLAAWATVSSDVASGSALRDARFSLRPLENLDILFRGSPETCRQ
jgi:hypothetical protein